MNGDEHEMAPDWEQVAVKEIRDKLLEMVLRHERENHGGEICHEHRLGTISFLMHSLGMHARMILFGTLIEDLYHMLAEYDEAHAEREAHDHDHHNGHGA